MTTYDEHPERSPLDENVDPFEANTGQIPFRYGSNAAAESAPTASMPQTPDSRTNTPPHWQNHQPPMYGQPAHGAGHGSYPGAAPSMSSAAATAKPKGGGVRTFFLAFAGALLACILAFGVAIAYKSITANRELESSSSIDTQLGAQTNTPIEVVGEDTSLAVEVAAKCLPSVVAVNIYSPVSTSTFNSYYGGTPSNTVQKTTNGSGVILSADGYILTNNHVVSGASGYSVTIDGAEYDATLVGTDPSSDVAVLKAEGNGFTPMEIGNSDALKVGEWVMTIGAPFGLEQSVATGIISATNRSQVMSSASYSSEAYSVLYPNMIQTDAAINPGNSGGALVNAEGKLVGINTMIVTTSNNYSGVGFAIPSNYAVRLAQQIIDGQTPTHAYLGVTLQNVNASIASRYGLSTTSGAYVASVISGSPAASAGLAAGDVITAFDGEEVKSTSELMLDIRMKAPGDTVTLKVNRDGQTKELKVTLGDDSTNNQTSQSQSNQNSQSDSNGLGFNFPNFR